MLVVYVSVGFNYDAIVEREVVDLDSKTQGSEVYEENPIQTQRTDLLKNATLDTCDWQQLEDSNINLLIALIGDDEDWYPESIERIKMADEWIAEAYVTDRPKDTRKSILPCMLETTFIVSESVVAAGEFNTQTLWDEIQAAGFGPRPRKDIKFYLNGTEVTFVMKSAGGVTGDSQTFVRNDEKAQTVQFANLSDQTGKVVLTLSDTIPYETLLAYLQTPETEVVSNSTRDEVASNRFTSTSPYFTFIAKYNQLGAFVDVCTAILKPRGTAEAFVEEYVTFDKSQFVVGEPFITGKEIAGLASDMLVGCGESVVISNEYDEGGKWMEVSYQEALIDDGWFGNGIEIYSNGAAAPDVLNFSHAGGANGNVSMFGKYDDKTSKHKFLIVEERRKPHGAIDPNGFTNCPCTFEYQFTVTETVSISPRE